MTIPAPVTESAHLDAPAKAHIEARRRTRLLTIITFTLTLVGLTLLATPGAAWPALIVLTPAAAVGVIALVRRAEGGRAVAVVAASLATAGVVGAVLVLLVQAGVFPVFEKEVLEPAATASDKTPLLVPSPNALPTQPGDDAPITEPFTIDQTAFGADPTVPGQWWYVVVIENADATQVFTDVSFTITAVSSAEPSTMSHSAPQGKDAARVRSRASTRTRYPAFSSRGVSRPPM